MKRYLFLFIMFLLISPVFAEDVIYTIEDGTKLQCISSKKSGSLSEYKNPVTDYYVFKNGKIYSDNLSKMFGNPQKPPKKVYKLCISSKYITFKDRLYRWGASHYKWVTIDRQTGKYSFEGKKAYNWAWYYQKSMNSGFCQIVK